MADLGSLGRQYSEVVRNSFIATALGIGQVAWAYANNGGPATGTGIRMGKKVYSATDGYYQEWRGLSAQLDALTRIDGALSNTTVQVMFKGSHVTDVLSNPYLYVEAFPPADYEILVYGKGTKRSETWTKTFTRPIRLSLSGSLAACSSGVAYSDGLDVAGGYGTKTWAITGTLPDGLSFSTSTGLITGSTTGVGTYKLTIYVSVGDGYKVFKDVVLTVS